MRGVDPYTGRLTVFGGVQVVETEAGTVIERYGKRETVTDTNFVWDAKGTIHCTKANMNRLLAEIGRRDGVRGLAGGILATTVMG